MENIQEKYEILRVGAGPIGLACAIEAKKNSLSSLIVEKGCLTHSIYPFPTNLSFFSTPDLLELGDIPFIPSGPKPTRAEILAHDKHLAQYFQLNVHLFEKDINKIFIENGRQHAKSIIQEIKSKLGRAN